MSLPQHTDVVIVGAGPAGLATALVLATNKVPFILLDALDEGQNHARAVVVHAYSLEQLDTVGAGDPLAAAGIRMRHMQSYDQYERVVTSIALGDALDGHTKYPFGVLIGQWEVEAILTERLVELGGTVHRQRTVTGLRELDDGVGVVLEGGEVVAAKFVVAADGSKSVVRTAAGIPFLDPRSKQPSVASSQDIQIILADLVLKEPLPPTVPVDRAWASFDPNGAVLLIPLPRIPTPLALGLRPYRFAMMVPRGSTAPKAADIEDFQRAITQRGPGHSTGATAQISSASGISRYRVRSGLAERFYARFGSGWVFLVGDSAHIHSPMGGQGMNAGLADGVQLGNALVERTEQAFASYEAKRRPAAMEVIKFAESLTVLASNRWLSLPGVVTLRNWILWLVAMIPGVARRAAWRTSGLVYRDP